MEFGKLLRSGALALASLIALGASAFAWDSHFNWSGPMGASQSVATTCVQGLIGYDLSATTLDAVVASQETNYVVYFYNATSPVFGSTVPFWTASFRRSSPAHFVDASGIGVSGAPITAFVTTVGGNGQQAASNFVSISVACR